MNNTGIVSFPGDLDPRAQEFRPRNLSPQTQITLLQPQIYFPYLSTGLQVLPFYDGGMGFQSSLSTAYVRPIGVNPPPRLPLPLPFPSAAPTRALLLSSVPNDVNEATVRRELAVFGEVRAVQMEALRDGIVTVHFYNLKHAQKAMAEIQDQHMQQQSRLRQFYNNALLMQNLGFEGENSQVPMPPPGCGLIAGRAVWAQFTVPVINFGSDAHNQGTIVIFNLDSEISSCKLKEIFEVFGQVKELRETPSKRHQRFVEFFDIRDAARALTEMNGKEINGKHVIIEFSRPGGHGRRFSNDASTTTTTNIATSNLVNNLKISSRSSNYTRNTKYQTPQSLPSPSPVLSLARSLSDASLSHHPFQTQQHNIGKKPSILRGHGSWDGKGRSNYGAVSAVGSHIGSLSLGSPGNWIGGEMDYRGSSSRRNTKKSSCNNNNNNGKCPISVLASPQQQGRQPRNRSWKGRQKNSDTYFLINEDAISESNCRDFRTTVMIKNIPNKYSQKLLLNMLDNHCIHCNEQISGDGDDQTLSSYDFVYLPIDFNNKCNVGYGFVNLTSPQATWRLYKAFHLQPWEVFNSRKICEVTYARLQGLEALKEHFKNSKFACETDEYLPVVFSPPRDGKLLTEPISIGGHTIAVNKKLIIISHEDDDSSRDNRLINGYNGSSNDGEGGHDDDDEDDGDHDNDDDGDGVTGLPSVIFTSPPPRSLLLQQQNHPMGAC